MSCATAHGNSGKREISVSLVTTDAGVARMGAVEIRDNSTGMTIRAERVDSHAPRKTTLGIPLDGRKPLGSLDDLLARVPAAE